MFKYEEPKRPLLRMLIGGSLQNQPAQNGVLFFFVQLLFLSNVKLYICMYHVHVLFLRIPCINDLLSPNW